MRFLGSQWVDGLRERLPLGQHRAERQRAKTTEGVGEKFPPVACNSKMISHNSLLDSCYYSSNRAQRFADISCFVEHRLDQYRSGSERSLRQWPLATARGTDSAPKTPDEDKPSIYIQERVQIQQRKRELAFRLRLQKLKRRLNFFGPGGASRHEPIAKIYLLAQVRPGLRFEPSGKRFGLLV